MQDLIQQLASELDKDPRHVENVVRLLDEGNTIPFIARYRNSVFTETPPQHMRGTDDDARLRPKASSVSSASSTRAGKRLNAMNKSGTINAVDTASQKRFSSSGQMGLRLPVKQSGLPDLGSTDSMKNR